MWSSRQLRPVLPHVAVLVAINLLSLFIRVVFDDAGGLIKPYMATYYAEQVANLSRMSWWQLLLPLNDFGGRWGPTGFLLVHFLESLLGEPRAFYLLNAVMISIGYILSYRAFCSLRLSIVFGTGLASSTFNYHVYSVSGSVIMLPLVTFLFMFAFSQFKYLTEARHSRAWFGASVLTCAALALSYEGWLDVLPLLWVVWPVLCWRLNAAGDIGRRNRSVLSLAMVTAMAFAYVLIKSSFGLEGLHPKGGEADLILTYGQQYSTLAAEDVISSYFTFFYTTVSTYLPPWLFSFSVSLWSFGPEKIAALQEGYHPQGNHLVLYNHLFLWRYYAGFTLAIFVMVYWSALKNLKASLNSHTVTMFVLLSWVLVGSPTHLIIKWRPMHSAPFLGYQTYLSIIGLTLLIAYLVAMASDYAGRIKAGIVTAVVLLDFAYCAYSRPALLSVMSQQSFLGSYPDPRQNLRTWISAN